MTKKHRHYAACEVYWNYSTVKLPGQMLNGSHTAGDEKQKKLDKALDEIKQRYGKDAVRRGRLIEAKEKDF